MYGGAVSETRLVGALALHRVHSSAPAKAFEGSLAYYHGTRVAIAWLMLDTLSHPGPNSGALLIFSFSGFMPAILNPFHVFMSLRSRDRGQSLLQQSCNP